MKKSRLNEKKQESSIPQRIKVKLDNKTTIIINRLSSLKIWKRRYPLAHVIQ